MKQNPSIGGSQDDFTCPYKALQDTVWVSDPANPVAHQTGPIRKGETVWLQAQPFGSGPYWQIARLIDKTVCFVQPHHFNSAGFSIGQ